MRHVDVGGKITALIDEDFHLYTWGIDNSISRSMSQNEISFENTEG